MPRFYHVDRRATLTEGAFIDRVKHNDVQPDVLQRRFRGEMGAAGAAIWEVAEL